MQHDMNYVIGSGWWCAGSDGEDRKRVYGSDQIRSKGFHALWYEAINKFTSPVKVLIVDSASPILPDMDCEDSKLEFLRLSLNAGHSTAHTGKFCGWMRSVLVGLEYALACDAAYFVYVEQDVLLYGEGFIEKCIERMKTPYMFGSGGGTPQILQQSIFIIQRNGIRRFLDRIHAIPERDVEVSPEDKFFIASSSMSRFSQKIYCWARTIKKKKLRNRIVGFFYKSYRGYDDIPFGFGRVRPMDFRESHFYFQHGSDLEIENYLKRVREG